MPENDEDRQMASLMRLHAAKSITESTRDRRLNVLQKPVLPASAGCSTIISFGGLKRENILKQKLNVDALGIVKRRKVEEAEGKASEKTDEVQTVNVSLVSGYSSCSSEEHS